ncbi:hypothetical protein YC2023_024513 [Brassica napus]
MERNRRRPILLRTINGWEYEAGLLSGSLRGRLVFPLPPANAVFAVGSDCRRWLQLAFAVAGGCGKLTSHKSPANAPIFNRSTSRTNLLKPLETATVRIHKLPQPQPQPLQVVKKAFKIQRIERED